MLILGVSKAAGKAFAKLLEEIAAALDLSMGQVQFLLATGGALLAFFVFYHLRRYVRAAPELPAEATFLAPGAPRASRRRLYAVLGLAAGALCLVIGYTFGSYDSSLPALGWLLIPASLLAMWIISLLDGRHKKDEAAVSPTEAPQDPLETYAIISLVVGLFVLFLGLACLEHALKARRNRETAARHASPTGDLFEARPARRAQDPGLPKDMSNREWQEAVAKWQKEFAQRQAGKKPSEGPENGAPAQEKPSPAAK